MDYYFVCSCLDDLLHDLWPLAHVASTHNNGGTMGYKHQHHMDPSAHIIMAYNHISHDVELCQGQQITRTDGHAREWQHSDKKT